MENTDKKTDKRLLNLRPAWKEGDPSPNPNGRPLGQRNYATLYKEALLKLAKANNKTAEEIEEEMLSKALVSARGGDYRFYKDILDRLYGTAQSKLDLTTGGQPFNADPETKALANKVFDEETDTPNT